MRPAAVLLRGIWETEMEYRDRLLKAVAHALGRYMAERFMCKDAEVQLRRYKRLGKALEDYDKTSK